MSRRKPRYWDAGILCRYPNKITGLMRDFRRNELKWFRKKLLGWYERSGRRFSWRRTSATRYEQVISELLLQRTRAETVALFFREFIKKYPSWIKLAEASKNELEDFLRPLGIWRRRAATLIQLSREMAKRQGRLPNKRKEIENLPGVGQYIANAIMMFIGRGNYPLLDTNVSRVLERYLGPRKLADIRYDPELQRLSKKAIDCSNSLVVNWALLDLAALICKPNVPRCYKCPLSRKCDYNISKPKAN